MALLSQENKIMKKLKEIFKEISKAYCQLKKETETYAGNMNEVQLRAINR